ncbi:hypothetical protein JCM8097_007955 [Rhodosporidiobolus ruineniae]
MSTTSTAALQACCVCGKETSTRCSACAKVGIELFFCSPEHQKLVWKGAHYKVCGSKAHPFLYPDMNAAEIEQVRRVAQVDAMSLLDPDGLDEVQSLRERRNMPPHAYRRLTLITGLCDLVNLPTEAFETGDPLQLGDRIKLQKNARGSVATVLRSSGELPALSQLDAFFPVAEFETHLSARHPGVVGTKEASQLLHLALVLFQLVKHKQQGSPPPFQAPFVFHAFRYLATACLHSLTFTDLSHLKLTMTTLMRLVEPVLEVDVTYHENSVSFKLRTSRD